MFIFKRKAAVDGGKDTFDQVYRVVIRDIEIFKKNSLSYHFVNQPGIGRTKILFAKIDCIFSLDFTNEEVEIVYKYKEPLNN